MQETKSTCCYCGVGCGVIIESDAGRISGVRGDPGHPANFGRLCTKGATLHLTARHDTRALYPELRDARGLARSRVGWDEALDHAALKFASLIRAHCAEPPETEIRREMTPGVTLAGLQSRLKCGTECGSCLPELKRMHAAQEARYSAAGGGAR